MTTMTANEVTIVATPRRRQPPGLMFWGVIVMTVVFLPAVMAMAIAILRTK